MHKKLTSSARALAKAETLRKKQLDAAERLAKEKLRVEEEAAERSLKRRIGLARSGLRNLLEIAKDPALQKLASTQKGGVYFFTFEYEAYAANRIYVPERISFILRRKEVITKAYSEWGRRENYNIRIPFLKGDISWNTSTPPKYDRDKVEEETEALSHDAFLAKIARPRVDLKKLATLIKDNEQDGDGADSTIGCHYQEFSYYEAVMFEILVSFGRKKRFEEVVLEFVSDLEAELSKDLEFD